MKAAIITHYGDPEKVVSIQEVDKPIPQESQVLIRVHAATINDYDWSLVTGKPYLYRLLFGVFKPRLRPGMEVSGIVESVGREVQHFKAGDAVYGDTSEGGFGTMAEYVAIHEKALVKKPSELSHLEAVCFPHASILALQGLRDSGKMQAGQNILINGGGGGVGSFALQLAKLQGCEVTGVDNASKLEAMKNWGYDAVIDYKKTNFTQASIQYDLILDCKSSLSPFSYLKALKPEGKYISVGGKVSVLLSLLFWGVIFRPFTKKRLQILALKPNKGLDYINKLVSENKLKATVDGPYKLEELPRLINYFGTGKHQGKIVVELV